MSGQEPDGEEEDTFKDPLEALYYLGLAIFCDDSPDFPEVISHWGKTPGKHGVLKGTTMPNLPTHPHHWVLGALLMAGAAVGKVVTAVQSMIEVVEAVEEP